VFPNRGHVKGDVLLVSVLCGHSGPDLVSDNVEGSSGHRLELEFLWLGCGGDIVGDDYMGVYEVSSCTGVYECGKGNEVLL